MANTNKVSFAVSVTPKILMDLANGINQEMEVINENVRRTVGGSGEITSNSGDATIAGGWADGVNTAVTSDGTTLAADVDTDLIFIKHTGFLFGTTTASEAADSVRVCLDGSATANLTGDNVAIATLTNGEAIALPRPGELSATNTLGYVLVTGNGSNHVGVETLIVAT